MLGNSSIALTSLEDWVCQAEKCASALKEQFGVKELSGYGLDGRTEAIRAQDAVPLYFQ
jgi:hypothetical protein